MPVSLSPIAAFATPTMTAGATSGLPLPSDTLAPADPILSPILNRSPRPLPIPQSPRPEFAELLTPAKLRRKRRHGVPHVTLPDSVAGPSTGGWQTGKGDVYRGATLDPTAGPADAKAEVDEDAVTFESSSSGSTWSIVSDLERGRRRTVAALERLGERIGVRRGSDASSASSLTSSRLDRPHELRHQGSRRQISMAGRITRTLTRRSSIDSTPEGPRREYIPRKREFALLLPEGEGDGDRVISTPSLPVVLDAIKALRVRNGLLLESANPTPAPSRGGSGKGHPRRPMAKRSQTSFAHPAVPIRLNTPLPSPLGLAQPMTFSAAAAAAATKPKSVSDLLHLPSPASAPNLTRLLSSFPSNPIPTSGPPKPQGAWWLDVSCPTWEDLRDIGELLSLHPLTLEDVLQQDPREKLDMFDKLGYYFVVIRALDETYFKYTPGTGSVASIGKNTSGTPSPAMSGDSGSTDLKDEKVGLGGSGQTAGSPELVTQNEKQKEGRRRGWGMGRAVGKLAGRHGEKVEIVEDNPGREGLEGVGVGAVNVYLAVFEDGVVSFHYEDISKHTHKVRDRILSLAGGAGAEHTSDWVAHGLIDSIVDAFFPLIRYVDGEVDDIDSLTIDPSVDPRAAVVRHAPRRSTTLSSDSHSPPIHPSSPEEPKMSAEISEKSPPLPGYLGRSTTPSPKSESLRNVTSPKPPLRYRIKHHLSRVHLPHLPKSSFASPLPNLFPSRFRQILHKAIYLRLFFLPISSAVRKRHEPPPAIFDRTTMLRRITDLRRLVTGLTRLLGTKHQVIGRMRKRAGQQGVGGRRGRGRSGADMELGGGRSAVEAYIGDVEDHILLLQTSLMHYEYILSHCQPAYLSHLQVSFLITRGGISSHILVLSVVTITILPLQLVTGLGGMNVRVPRDGDKEHLDENGDPAGFITFGVIVAIVFAIVCAMVALVRWWRWTARRKFAEKRGVEVPNQWDGYWGWK